MPLPTTTLALFDLLAADTVLTPLLGVHVLASGTTRPALAHFWPKEAIEPTTQPAGVVRQPLSHEKLQMHLKKEGSESDAQAQTMRESGGGGFPQNCAATLAWAAATFPPP